jgi:hypothetical protein
VSLREVSDGNDTLAQLVELRKILANAIDNCDSYRDLASLSRRYVGVIEAVSTIEGGMDDDTEIASIILRKRQSDSD